MIKKEYIIIKMPKIFFHINIIFIILYLNIYIFPHIHCGISIAQPAELANKFFNSDIEAVYGNFGSIDLGFEALGSIWIKPQTEKSNLSPNYACESLQDIKILKDNYNFADFNVVLVDKGSCSFPKMAKEVEKIGGDMILIINNEPGSVSGYKVTNDDGRGNEVSIPVAMISYNDGKAIMDYIINHPKQNVYLNIEIGMNQRNKVKIDLFTHILNLETYKFLTEFQSYFYKLDKYIEMNIYYLTPKLEGLIQSKKLSDCLNDGLFCQKNTNTNINKDITGIDLIYESLYHQCLFQRSKKSYFKIISQYSEMCLTKEQYSNFCGLDLFNADMREIIMDCVFNSFGNSDYEKKWKKPEEIKSKLDTIKSNTNTILVNNRLKEMQFNVNSYPDIYINDIKYSQRFSSMYVFGAICTAFNPMPTPCKDYILRPTNIEKEGIPWYDIVLIILAIILINSVLYYCIRRCVIKRLNERINVDENDLSGQINSVISSYFSLKDMHKKNLEYDDDDDEEKLNQNSKINNISNIETIIDKEEDNLKDEQENNSKLIISNTIDKDNIDNNINNNKKDEEEEKENEKKEE